MLLLHILDLVELELDTWTAMGALPEIAGALVLAHEALKAAGVNDRRIISLLRKLGVAGHTSAESASQFEQEYQALLVVSTRSYDLAEVSADTIATQFLSLVFVDQSHARNAGIRRNRRTSEPPV